MIHFHWSIFRQNLYLWGFSSHIRIFMPSRSKIGGVYCFCPVCHSVLISETLILLITFEQWVLELWYFTWVFLMVRPFRGYLFLPLWPWPWSLTYFLKNLLTLLITFEQWVLELWYFTWVLSVARPFCVYHYFLHVTLTLEFDLSLNFFYLC